MAWQERMARELKQRNNPTLPVFFTGKVVSASPLTISAFGGNVMLSGGQLRRVDPWMQCTAYESCSPTGGATCDHSGRKALADCAGCAQGKCLVPRPLQVGQEVALAGSQTYFILGVVTGG